MGNIVIKSVDVEPKDIDIFDIKRVERLPNFFAIYPSFYNCRILFSPLVIQEMLKWLIEQHFVELSGTLTIKVSTQRRTYFG